MEPCRLHFQAGIYKDDKDIQDENMSVNDAEVFLVTWFRVKHKPDLKQRKDWVNMKEFKFNRNVASEKFIRE